MALLKVISDILLADSGDLAMLTLLNLSAAFDMLDHHILVQHLKTTYSINGTVLGWLTCYLSKCTQFVLHWLHIRERINYKLCVIVFKCQHSLAPA